MKQAGALILGKTVSTEFAYFAPGPTRNPRNLRHTPGGSSSGSAAAVAAGLCPMALGTQTIGSIIRPAAFCGVVGFRTTPGLNPVYPSLLAYDQLAVEGPMARTVRDTALILTVVAGEDSRAPISFPSDPQAFLSAVESPEILFISTPDASRLTPYGSS